MIVGALFSFASRRRYGTLIAVVKLHTKNSRVGVPLLYIGLYIGKSTVPSKPYRLGNLLVQQGLGWGGEGEGEGGGG